MTGDVLVDVCLVAALFTLVAMLGMELVDAVLRRWRGTGELDIAIHADARDFRRGMRRAKFALWWHLRARPTLFRWVRRLLPHYG